MNSLDLVHGRLVHTRRVRRLCEWLEPLLPAGSLVVDIGAGDGQLARRLLDSRPDLSIEGLDVLVRPESAIPVRAFDGLHLPFADRSVDVALLVDVLHHAERPAELLAEAARIARRCVVIKDHRRDGWLAQPTLRFMDWVGNARHGVALRYEYWPTSRWREVCTSLDLEAAVWETSLGLYPWPADWLFGRSLHVIAQLVPASRATMQAAPLSGVHTTHS